MGFALKNFVHVLLIALELVYVPFSALLGLTYHPSVAFGPYWDMTAVMFFTPMLAQCEYASAVTSPAACELFDVAMVVVVVAVELTVVVIVLVEGVFIA